MTIKCKNWDSDKPERLINDKGKDIGVLIPRRDQPAAEIELHSAEIINLADYRSKR